MMAGQQWVGGGREEETKNNKALIPARSVCFPLMYLLRLYTRCTLVISSIDLATLIRYTKVENY